MDNPNIVKNYFRNVINGDWGSFRIRIHKLFSNNKKRDEFFLHGGSELGSAGCIDVGGGLKGNDNTKKLIKLIENSKNINSIPLEVVK